MLAIFQTAGLLPPVNTPPPRNGCSNCPPLQEEVERPPTVESDGRIWCACCGTALDVVFDRCPDYDEDGFLYDRPNPLLEFGNGMTETVRGGRGSYLGRQLHHQALDQRDRNVLQGSKELSQAAQCLGLGAAVAQQAALLYKELLVGQETVPLRGAHAVETRVRRSRRKLLVACLWTALTRFPEAANQHSREAVAAAMNATTSDLQEGCQRYGYLQRRCQLTAPLVKTPVAAQEEALERCHLSPAQEAQARQLLARAGALDLLPAGGGEGGGGGAWAGLMALGAAVYGWPLESTRCAQIAGVTVQTVQRHYAAHVKRLPELLSE